MKTTDSFYFEIGAFRISHDPAMYEHQKPEDIYGTSKVPGLVIAKDGFIGPGIDRGRDGIVVYPEKRIVAIADGVGKLGNGNDALKAFLDVLQETRDFFAACLALNRSGKHRSTFIAIKFPKTFQQKAKVFSIGDSTILHFRSQARVIEDLNYSNRLHAFLMRECPELLDKKKRLIKEETLKEYMRKIIALIFRCLVPGKKIPPKLRYWIRSFIESDDLESKRSCLISMFLPLHYLVWLDLGSSEERVKRRMREVRFSIALTPGDAVILHTDGVNRSHKMIENALETEEAPVTIARRIVLKSTVHDDRAAIVVKAEKNPCSQKLPTGPIFTSLLS